MVCLLHTILRPLLDLIALNNADIYYMRDFLPNEVSGC